MRAEPVTETQPAAPTAPAAAPAAPPPALPAAPPMDPAELRKALWAARLYYFAYFGALGAVVPFFNVFLQQQGMSGPQIGLISSFPPLVSMISNPFWGLVADRWQLHRRVLVTCALMAGLTSFGFIFVNRFFSIVLVFAIMIFFRTPISAIVDTTVMGLVAANPNVDYSRQRVFGSFGWIAASLSVGYLVSTVSINAIFMLHGLLLAAICTLLSLRLPIQRNVQRGDFRAGLRDLLKLPSYRALLLMMVLYGMAASGYLNFTSLYILSLGGTAALVGISNAASATLEIPVMFLNSRWARHVGGRATIVIAMLGIASTLLLLGSARTPGIIPLYQAIFGIFFALLWPAMVAFVYTAAPTGLRASAQTFAQAMHGGLGWALGSLLSGFLWARNPTLPFYAAAAMAFAGALVFYFGTRNSRG